MRYLVCLGIGLFVGLLCALTASGLMRPRETYPRAMMNVMKHALGTARSSAATGGCDGNDARLQMLGLLAAEVAPTFLIGETDERVFARYAERLRERVAEAAKAGACPAQAAALTAIDNACEDCHRDYR